MRAVSSEENTHTFNSLLIKPALFWAFIFCWLLVYAPTGLSIVEEWSFSGALGHGYLVAPFALYLMYIYPFSQPCQPARLSIIAGVVGLLVCCGIWWAADKMHVLTLAQVAWLCMLFAGCLAYFGFRWLLHHWLALAILVLAMPFWTYLVKPLRDISTHVSVSVLQWLDIPVLNNGYLIQVPAGSFFVEDSCSGLGFFLVALFLTAAFSALNRLRWHLALIVLLVSIMTAIVANWIRIIVIILVGNATEMQHAIVTDHLTFGWLLFVGLLVPLLVFYHYLLKYPPRAFKPAVYSVVEDTVAKRVLGSVLLTIVLLVPAYDALQRQVDVSTYRPELLSRLHGDHTFVAKTLSWQPHFVKPAEVISGDIRLDGIPTDIYTAYYPREQAGEEVVYVENRLYNDHAWSLLFDHTISLNEHTLHYVELERIGGRRAMLYWYDIGGQIVGSAWRAKLAALSSRTHAIEGAAFVAISLPVVGDDSALTKDQLLARARVLLNAP